MSLYIMLVAFLFTFVSMGCATDTNYNQSITFACVCNPQQRGFEFITFNTEIYYTAMNSLREEKGLMMFFLGFEAAINRTHPCGTFARALAWHKSTDTNICMVQYPYLNEDSHFTLKNIRNAIKKRFSVVAEQASDFVIKLKTQNVIKSLDDVVMAGFSFGGHISAYTCRSLEKIFKQKVKALFGLDPAGVPKWMDETERIREGDAKYVQVIHTSGFQGTLSHSSAYHDVVVGNGLIQDGCKSNADFLCSHSRSAEIFDVTISKKYRFVATNDGKKGTYTKLDGKDREPTVKLKDHECLVGYYAAFNVNLPKRGKYSIDLPKQLFGNAANETGKISKIFKNFFDLGKDQDKQKIKKSK